MTLNSDAKYEETLDLWFQKWQEELGELSLEHSNSEKLYIGEISLWKSYNNSATHFQRNYES